MSKRDTQTALEQIYSHAVEALDLVQGKSQREVVDDRVLNLAITRLMEIIGEAANRIPKQDQEIYPDLPWIQMIGLRNRLIHGYDEIDFDILWVVLSEDLPDLIQKLEKHLEK